MPDLGILEKGDYIGLKQIVFNKNHLLFYTSVTRYMGFLCPKVLRGWNYAIGSEMVYKWKTDQF